MKPAAQRALSRSGYALPAQGPLDRGEIRWVYQY